MFITPFFTAAPPASFQCGLRLPWREAAIPLPRHLCAGRIDLVPILQECAYRRVETVKVEFMEGRSLGGALWVCSQSTNARTSSLRHIPVGKRAKAVHSEERIFEMSDVETIDLHQTQMTQSRHYNFAGDTPMKVVSVDLRRCLG
jgi:hypothetical protein